MNTGRKTDIGNEGIFRIPAPDATFHIIQAGFQLGNDGTGGGAGNAGGGQPLQRYTAGAYFIQPFY
ncbi:hypothetical protein RAA17_15835 [Komagataeibacter rhaeticus]|nr:hypothetical protein [Komagataeibacter rhaeticus]